jgi:hypothetical protein
MRGIRSRSWIVTLLRLSDLDSLAPMTTAVVGYYANDQRDKNHRHDALYFPELEPSPRVNQQQG